MKLTKEQLIVMNVALEYFQIKLNTLLDKASEENEIRILQKYQTVTHNTADDMLNALEFEIKNSN